jgi:hypothetical protein
MAASNFASVKLSHTLVSDARREAQILNRSLGGQIEHWANLGRALENAAGVSLDRVRQTLEGRLSLETLSVAEQDAVFDRLGQQFDQPPEVVRQQYAALGARPGAVGEDDDGRLVRRRADGGVEPIG